MPQQRGELSAAVGAGKLDKEQVILNEVVPKGCLRQGAISHPSGEGMLGVSAPLGERRCLQALKEAHGVLPDLVGGVALDCLL